MNAALEIELHYRTKKSLVLSAWLCVATDVPGFITDDWHSSLHVGILFIMFGIVCLLVFKRFWSYLASDSSKKNGRIIVRTIGYFAKFVQNLTFFGQKSRYFFRFVDFFRPSSGLGGIYNLHFRAFQTFSFRAKKKLEIKKMFFNISPTI